MLRPRCGQRPGAVTAASLRRPAFVRHGAVLRPSADPGFRSSRKDPPPGRVADRVRHGNGVLRGFAALLAAVRPRARAARWSRLAAHESAHLFRRFQQFPPTPREAVPRCDFGEISTTRASNRGSFEGMFRLGGNCRGASCTLASVPARVENARWRTTRSSIGGSAWTCHRKSSMPLPLFCVRRERRNAGGIVRGMQVRPGSRARSSALLDAMPCNVNSHWGGE